MYSIGREKRMMRMKSNYDVVIIGAGVTGCAIAREVSKYNLSCCVLEKEEDVCSGTSKANSAIVHAGYDATPGRSEERRVGKEGRRECRVRGLRVR